jgi:hypothetical protein
MLKRLTVLALVTLLVIGVLTCVRPSGRPVLPPAARAQEPLPLPNPSDLGAPARDPATVASELMLEPPAPVVGIVERPPARWASLGYVNEVGANVSRLRRQVRQFKQDVTADLQGERRRELSRQADDVLDALDAFEGRLVVGMPRTTVYEDYAAVEGRVKALTRDARFVGLSRPAGRDSTQWVAMADEKLGEAVHQGQGREVWEPALVARESDNLVFLTRDLERKGEYALSAGPGRRTLQSDLHALSDAAEFFRASVAAGSPRSRLVQDFGPVAEVWGHVVPAVAGPTRGERLAVGPRASAVEDVILKLHRRLGLPGAPARLEANAEPAQPVNGLGLPMRTSPERWSGYSAGAGAR